MCVQTFFLFWGEGGVVFCCFCCCCLVCLGFLFLCFVAVVVVFFFFFFFLFFCNAIEIGLNFWCVHVFILYVCALIDLSLMALMVCVCVCARVRARACVCVFVSVSVCVCWRGYVWAGICMFRYICLHYNLHIPRCVVE